MNASIPALPAQLQALLEGECDPVANAANLAALCWLEWSELSWVGVYFFRDGELVLGPFQGKPACTRIGLHEGVCGAAARSRATQIVADVHAFPGHIACDSASASELVVPILDGDTLLGVLDLDSTRPARFSPADAVLAQELAAVYVASLQQPLRRRAHAPG